MEALVRGMEVDDTMKLKPLNIHAFPPRTYYVFIIMSMRNQFYCQFDCDLMSSAAFEVDHLS